MPSNKDWCGTEPTGDLNLADQAPPPSEMPAFPEGKAFYPCITQDGIMNTFGKALGAEIKQEDGWDELVVGDGPIIPRWSGTAATPAKLLYYTVREGFPSDEDFKYAAKAFQDAADEWNAINFGVKITPTQQRSEAIFNLVFFKPAPDPNRSGNVIASAFFPNKVKDVRCYEFALKDAHQRSILKNTFLHEIGHILGLRHEFAIVEDTEGNGPESQPAVQFGSKNPISVMSYEDVVYIQPTDKEDIVKFYQLPNRFKIDDVEVTDFIPKPLPARP